RLSRQCLKHRGSQHFAELASRESVEHDDFRRRLESRKPTAREPYDLGGVDRRVALDRRLDPLSPFGVLDTDDGRVPNTRKLLEGALHLDRRDVLSPADDHVVLAAEDEEKSLAIDLSEVSGVE